MIYGPWPDTRPLLSLVMCQTWNFTNNRSSPMFVRFSINVTSDYWRYYRPTTYESFPGFTPDPKLLGREPFIGDTTLDPLVTPNWSTVTPTLPKRPRHRFSDPRRYPSPTLSFRYVLVFVVILLPNFYTLSGRRTIIHDSSWVVKTVCTYWI